MNVNCFGAKQDNFNKNDYQNLKNPEECIPDFINKINECKNAPSAVIINICKEFIEAGEPHAKVFVQNFKEFDIKNVKEKDIFDLCNKIVAQGWSAARTLAENFDKFGIKDSKHVIDLCNKIVEKGGSSAGALAENFDKFGIKDSKDVIDLCNKIVEEGEYALQDRALGKIHIVNGSEKSPMLLWDIFHRIKIIAHDFFELIF